MSTSYIYGTGRRKTSVARVRLLPGDVIVFPSAGPRDDSIGRSIPNGKWRKMPKWQPLEPP